MYRLLCNKPYNIFFMCFSVTRETISKFDARRKRFYTKFNELVKQNPCLKLKKAFVFDLLLCLLYVHTVIKYIYWIVCTFVWNLYYFVSFLHILFHVISGEVLEHNASSTSTYESHQLQRRLSINTSLLWKNFW